MKENDEALKVIGKRYMLWNIQRQVYALKLKDRTLRGDYFEKPTQYWFINCEPRYNMILEAYSWNKKKIINNTSSKTERSLISKEYANRFIREFIVDVKE